MMALGHSEQPGIPISGVSMAWPDQLQAVKEPGGLSWVPQMCVWHGARICGLACANAGRGVSGSR
jgi:hypothetical protein